MSSKIEFYSELLLKLCQKHAEFLNTRIDLYVAARANNTLDSDEYKSEFHNITNNVVFTFNAFKMVRHILFGTHTYSISFEEIKELYDNNNSLSSKQAVDLLFEEIKKLIGNEDLDFNYLLLDDDSIQVNLSIPKIEG